MTESKKANVREAC